MDVTDTFVYSEPRRLSIQESIVTFPLLGSFDMYIVLVRYSKTLPFGDSKTSKDDDVILDRIELIVCPVKGSIIKGY